MTPAARLAAVIEVLEEISAVKRPADQVASFYFKGRRYIGSKDRRAIADMVWAVLRRQARLNWWLDHLNHLKGVRALVLAHCAFEGLPLTPDMFSGVHATYGLDADERKLIDRIKGQDIFHRDQPAWVKGEFPQWLTPRLQSLWGDDMAREIAAMRDEAPLDLRINTLKTDRATAIKRLASEKVQAQPTPISPLGVRLKERIALVQSPTWRDGWVEVQDEGSQLVALLTDPKPGEAVCDFCAGAGGKTLALAAAMQNKGRLVACDVAEWRMDKAQDRFRRAGIHNITRRVLESETDKWVKRSAKSFDRVLVDAPCTGTGTWRRNPDAKWQLQEQDLLELVERQASILASAARLVKPGGRLVYATCSVMAEENENQVLAFLSAHPDFQLLSVPHIWSAVAETPCPVTTDWLRLTPRTHHTDGFFAAALQRKDEQDSAEPAP